MTGFADEAFISAAGTRTLIVPGGSCRIAYLVPVAARRNRYCLPLVGAAEASTGLQLVTTGSGGTVRVLVTARYM